MREGPPDPVRRNVLAAIGIAAVAAITGVAGAMRPKREPAIAVVDNPSASTASSTTTTTPAIATTSPPPIETTTTTTAPGDDDTLLVSVICRDAWDAKPAGEFTTHTISRMTVHHTATPLDDNSLAPGRIRQHQSFHQDKGWPDLAYHFIIDLNGHIYEGRPVSAVGDTGTNYDPTSHFLACLEGNYSEQEPTQEQWDSLVALLAWASQEHEVGADTIRGHRDVAETACPGDNVYQRISDGSLAELVRQAGRTNHELDRLCGEAGLNHVNMIQTGEL